MQVPGADTAGWQVVCLCAEWCGVCRQWKPVFDALRERFPQATFAWIDVEDHADAMGDVEIETFPTLLVAHGGTVRFAGPVQPSFAQVTRLLDSLLAQTEPGSKAGPESTALLERLRTVVLLKR